MKKLKTNYLPNFLHYLQEYRGYSTLTVKTYKAAIEEALDFIEIEYLNDKTLWHLMPYRLHIAPRNPKTITKKLSAIRSFVEYLNEQQGMGIVLDADESVKVAKTLPKPIAHQHIVEALAHTQDIQEYLVVVMLYTLGLRISELSSLRVSNIDKEWIRVMGKGSKERDVPLLETTHQLIEKYLDAFSPKKFLFEKNGEKLSENSLRYMVTKVFRRIAIHVTPHQLRHSYATALLNSGAPIVDVSELLGHQSMATTQIYTQLGSTLKQQNYNKAHPLCGLDKGCV